jgi:DNA-directed RNA polymerase subunit RPC12/RpoP
MPYQFLTCCAICAKPFGVLWVMDPIQVGTKNIARITCPHCGKRFSQDAKELRAIGSQIQNLVVGRSVRSVEVDYDCPHCSNRGILVSLLHTDLSWDELCKENIETAVCDNGLCPQRGLIQKLKPSRVVLGSLNPA